MDKTVYATAVPADHQPAYAQGYSVQPNAPPAMASNAGMGMDMNRQLNEAGAREFLLARKWPAGLTETFITNIKEKVAYRCFICDDVSFEDIRSIISIVLTCE